MLRCVSAWKQIFGHSESAIWPFDVIEAGFERGNREPQAILQQHVALDFASRHPRFNATSSVLLLLAVFEGIAPLPESG